MCTTRLLLNKNCVHILDISCETGITICTPLSVQENGHQHARKCYERMVDESQLALRDAQAELGWIDFECEEYDHRQAS
jgi:hypothetical protein